MDFMFKKDQNILLLGEGNFSFCRDLVLWMKANLSIREPGKFTNVFASCFEDECSASINEEVKEFLLSEGVHLMYGVDATDLERHKCVAEKKFNLVVFNFPHIKGKMRMDLNRLLLNRFFISAASVLASDGNVIVSLCEGQGGTPADKSRRYDDTWKVVESGAAGGLVLVRVSLWPVYLLSNYCSSGFRGGQKSFRTEGAIVHTFKPIEPLATNKVPDDLVGYTDVPFSDGLRVSHAHKRLLQHNSVSWKHSIQRFLESRIVECLPNDATSLGDLPLTTPSRLDDSQIECVFRGEPAFLRTSFDQVIPERLFAEHQPIFTSGVIFRKTDATFSSYPGSYKMLISGCDVPALLENIRIVLKVPLDTRWYSRSRENVIVLDLDLLSLAVFKTSLASTKTLWNPRTRIVANGDRQISGVSLYPPSFTFDLSFSSNGPLPDEPFLNLMHNLADHCVECIALQSRYSPEGSYAVYHCYRITYRSYDKPLHRAAVVAFQQNAIRYACERYLEVAVR